MGTGRWSRARRTPITALSPRRLGFTVKERIISALGMAGMLAFIWHAERHPAPTWIHFSLAFAPFALGAALTLFWLHCPHCFRYMPVPRKPLESLRRYVLSSPLKCRFCGKALS